MELSRQDRPEIRVIESSSTYSVLSLEPLEKGYGDTLGNALRRVLLSSIRGTAITAVRIAGVLHEFSTVPGVREDVIEILMNLKHIPILSYSKDIKTLRLEMDGPGEVRAKDILPDSEVEFVDPEAKICTLAEGGHIEMDIYIEQGVGYESVERQKPAWLPIDALLVDGLFSPVLRVNYEVELTRVKQRTDFEKLKLQVWTNGVITPELAVREAAKILSGYFSNVVFDLAQYSTKPEDEELEGASAIHGAGRSDELSRSIKDLEFSIRSENCLSRGGINTLGDLVNCSRNDLLKIRNLGKVSLVEIIEKLETMGFSLKENKETEE